MSINHKEQYLTLSQVADSIGSVLDDNFGNQRFLVVAEISGMRISKGHCYLTLIEKEEGSVDPVAEMRAVIWRENFNRISSHFRAVTGEEIKANIKILLCATVRFHIRYGLSLMVEDIEPSFTIGQMQQERMKVIAQLKEKGIYEKNKTLVLPLVPQRIAVISAENSFGYEDFKKRLTDNPFRYKFFTTLFASQVQGEKAAADISGKLREIGINRKIYDVIVMVRGGGGNADFNCYNNHALAEAVATCPLPVVTGIGHTVNISVTDEVAHTCRITPTDAAAFLIEEVWKFETAIDNLYQEIIAQQNSSVRSHADRMNSLSARLAHEVRLGLQEQTFLLAKLEEKLFSDTGKFIAQSKNILDAFEKRTALLDPLQVLKRGYSLTLLRGKTVRSQSGVAIGDVLQTVLPDGNIISRVEREHNTQKSET